MKLGLVIIAMASCVGCGGHTRCDGPLCGSSARIEPLDCRSLDPVNRCIDPRCAPFCNDAEDAQCAEVCRTDPRCADSECAK